MTDLETLQATNIVRLQAAARMAGLRWKNGEPGTDKAGLIARLANHPSIMRATLATLERMAKGDPIPAPTPSAKRSSLLDDLASDAAETPPSGKTEIDTAILQAYALKTDLIRLAEACKVDIGSLRDNLTGQIESMQTAIEALSTRRPIEFKFPDHRTITIDPAQHHVSFPKLVKYLQINRRVILVGSAGTGKSLAVKNAADALGVKFYLVPPVTMSHELIGHRDAQGNFHPTPLTEAYTKGGLVLMDEADASLPDALLCANPIFDGNGFATLGDGELHAQHPDFYAVFNMNTDGFGATMQYAGRNRLDGATIARFGVRIEWEIDATIETKMAAGQNDWHRVIVAVRRFMADREIVDVNATPRHLKTGAMLINAGLDRREVLADVLKNGAVGAAWSEVLRLSEVAQFLRGQ